MAVKVVSHVAHECANADAANVRRLLLRDEDARSAHGRRPHSQTRIAANTTPNTERQSSGVMGLRGLQDSDRRRVLIDVFIVFVAEL